MPPPKPLAGLRDEIMLPAFALLLGLAAPLAHAQAAGTQAGNATGQQGYAVRDGRQVYEPIYFANITPRTAADMLFEVPGFQVTSTGGGRGLGQGGTNVLINGARLTGKGTGPVDILRRTPASAVIRIEIVDAASLGIPGLTGQVADVYLAPQGLTGNWSLGPSFREGLEPNLANVALSVSGETGPITFTLGFENDSARRGNRGPELVIDPDGVITERRLEDGQFYVDRPEATGALVWNRDNGDLANLAATYSLGFFSSDESRDAILPGQIFVNTQGSRKEDEREGEVSGDYATDALGGRLKLIGLYRWEHSPVERLFLQRGSDGGFEGGYFDQTIDEGERIGRAEMVWGALGGTLEVAAEGAFNFLEAEDDGGEVFADGTSVSTGRSAVRVEELRGQGSVALSRPLGPIDVQASVGGEVSEISQPGGTNPPRTLVRPNGFLSAAYEWGDDTDLRLRVERSNGQLNFFDFVASVDLVDGTEQCANPDIVPEQSWSVEGQLVRRFGAQTQFTLTTFGERITDVVDLVPLPCGEDGAGNIDTATVYGAEFQGTVQLNPVWQGLELDLSLFAQESRLDDPFTGLPRGFSDDEEWSWSFDLRRDVPSSPWSYGVGGNQARFAVASRRIQVTRDTQDPFFYVFAEHRDVFGAELNVFVGNVFEQEERFRREVFEDTGPGLRGPLLFTESRERTFGPILRVRLTDTF